MEFEKEKNGKWLRLKGDVENKNEWIETDTYVNPQNWR